MASCFTALDLVASRTINAVHGEAWRHIPMDRAGDVNAPPVAAVDRSPADVTGIYREPTANPFIPNGFDPRSSQRPGVASGHPEVEIDPRLCATPVEIRGGDNLIHVASGKTWRVMKIRTDEMGRFFAAVNLSG